MPCMHTHHMPCTHTHHTHIHTPCLPGTETPYLLPLGEHLTSHSATFKLTHHHGCAAPRVQVAGFVSPPSREAPGPGTPGLQPQVPPALRAHPVQEPQHAHQHRDQTGETEFNPWEGDTGHVPQEAGGGQGGQHGAPGETRRQTGQCYLPNQARGKDQLPKARIRKPLSKGPWWETFLSSAGPHSPATHQHLPRCLPRTQINICRSCGAKSCFLGTCPLWSCCCPPKSPKRNQFHLDGVFQKGHTL